VLSLVETSGSERSGWFVLCCVAGKSSWQLAEMVEVGRQLSDRCCATGVGFLVYVSTI
jgi:hypothetical protein